MEMRKATPQAARSLAKDVREVDQQEWEYATRQPFLGQLLAGLVAPESHNWALWEDGECLAAFGVQPYGCAGVGRAWFAGSNKLMGRVQAAHGHFKRGIGLLHKHYPTLIASSWHPNKVHHKWMQKMGFTLIDTEILGRQQFLVFARTDRPCAPQF